MHRTLPLVIVLSWMIVTPNATTAQAAGEGIGTPRPGGADPANCIVAPRSPEVLRQLARDEDDPDAPPPIEEATPAPSSALPAGDPVDARTVAEITAVAEQFLACINAGDALRLYALVSDNLIPRLLDKADVVPEELRGPPNPFPDEDWFTLGEVSGVRMLADGRVGAVVAALPPADDPVFMIFTREEDRWLIDGLISVAIEEER